MEKDYAQQSQDDNNNLSQYIVNFRNEISSKSRDGLKTVGKKLNYLCLNLDPYNCLDLKQEEENIINEFELKEYLSNPFRFTNILLQLLDLVEAELKSRSH
jgi:hypothetical protein